MSQRVSMGQQLETQSQESKSDNKGAPQPDPHNSRNQILYTLHFRPGTTPTLQLYISISIIMLSSGPSQSPATPRLRKPHGGDAITGEGSIPDNSSLEQRMQYMIDMQYAYTESFRQDQDGVIVVEDVDASTANNGNDTNSRNNNDNDLLPSYSQTDLNVGRGQLIFSNKYYEQEHLHLLPPSPSMNPPHRAQPRYDGYNAIDTTFSMVDTDPDHVTDDQRFLTYLNHSHDPNKNNFHNEDQCCCCLWDPIVESLRYLMHADSLHRSFCYAAIDGMLTGAGLVATLVGFTGPLTAATAATTSSTLTGAAALMTRPSPWMVAVCFTACTADALCMAVSHVWNTHVVSTLAARERRDERLAFSRNRNEAKAKLVDRLLNRGMLKIDAASIADTLEGYPDIFVGALVGDAVVGMPQEHENDDNTYPLGQGYNNNHSNGGGGGGGIHNPRALAENYRSYGQFREWDHDPDAAGASAAVSESQTEAMVMAAAFSIFGTLPALMYYGASCWVVLLSLSNSNGKETSDTQQSISARSAAMTLGCTIIWFLGVWKR